MEARRPEARYNPGMTRKQFSALAFCAICALAPLNNARAEEGEGEKSPAPPAQPEPKSEAEKPADAKTPKAPQDPKIAALVKELEDPEDHEKRAKTFDALIALGEGGIAAVRESLSCRGAKVVIESTVTPQSAPPNTPIKVEFRLKNAGTGTLWVPRIPEGADYFGYTKTSPSYAFGMWRLPNQRKPWVDTGAEHPLKPLDGKHPLDSWRPVRGGELVCRRTHSGTLDKYGMQSFQAYAALVQTEKTKGLYPVQLPASGAQGPLAEPLSVGSAFVADEEAGVHSARAFALPDLAHLPAEGPLAIDIEPKHEDIPARVSHLECTIKFRNTKEAGDVLLEKDLTGYAWIAWIDEKGQCVDGWSIRHRCDESYKAVSLPRRVSPGQGTGWHVNLLRPAKLGTYRLLAGYEVVPGGTEPSEIRPPSFSGFDDDEEEGQEGAKADFERVVQAKAFALSNPIRIEAPFEFQVPAPLEGEPAHLLSKEPLSARMIKVELQSTISFAESYRNRTGQKLRFADKKLLTHLRPALFHARSLSDEDIEKIQVYYYCGEALLANAQLQPGKFESPYAEFCLRKAAGLAAGHLPDGEALKSGCLLALAELHVKSNRFEDAARTLDTARTLLEPSHGPMPWDWVRYLHLRMQLLTATGAPSAALALYREQLAWMREEFGANSVAEVLVTATALSAAQALKEASPVEELTARQKQLEEERKAAGKPFFSDLMDTLDRGKQLNKEKRYVEAERVLRKAYHFAAADTTSDWYESRAAEALSTNYLESNQPKKALAFALRVVAFQERRSNRSSLLLASALCQTAGCLDYEGNFETSRPYMKRAQELVEKIKNGEDPGKSKAILEALDRKIKTWFEEHP